MGRRICVLLTVALTLLFCPGCWDTRPIESLALVFIMGVDVNSEDSQLLDFTFGHPLFHRGRKSDAKHVTVTAPHFTKARELWQAEHDGVFAGGRIRLLVVGEDVARMHMQGLLYYFQLPEMDNNAALVVVQGRASDYMKSELPETDRIGFHSSTVLDTAAQQGLAIKREVDDTVVAWASPGIDPVAPTMRLAAGKDLVTVTGTALFRDVNLVEWLDIEYTRVLLILMGESNIVFISPPLGSTEEFASPVPQIMLIRPKVSLKPMVRGEELTVEVSLTSSYTLLTYLTNADITDKATVDRMTRDLESNMTLAIQKLLAILQEARVDPLGVGRLHRVKNFTTYDDTQFRELWSRAALDVKVNLRYYRGGSMIRTFFQPR
jgi:Ger(x)C family germination protein